MSAKARSLYGFSPELEPFAGQSVEEQVRTLQGWGITAVFGGYQDPSFCHAAHRAGLQVFAEFGCFCGQRWWTRAPASKPITDDGTPLEPEEWYFGVNPSTPEVRQEQLQALERLVVDRPIDGVWLDFIRWPCHWEVPAPVLPRTSFDPGTLARFQRDTGVQLPAGRVSAVARIVLDRHWEAWTAWRCEQITSWVALAKARIAHVRPDVILGLFGVPWRLGDHEGAILHVIGQDYGALGPYVDVFSPMAYHRMCARTTQWIAQVTEEIHTLSGKPVWPIIQSVNMPDALSAQEYGEALQTALHCPASAGALVFTMEAALDPAKLAVTQATFSASAAIASGR
jgi:hypothetical protein